MRVPPRIASGVAWVASTLTSPWETMQIRNQARRDRAGAGRPAEPGDDERPREDPDPSEAPRDKR
jgi:hypothetical protein